jgi:hypothetical protein
VQCVSVATASSHFYSNAGTNVEFLSAQETEKAIQDAVDRMVERTQANVREHPEQHLCGISGNENVLAEGAVWRFQEI